MTGKIAKNSSKNMSDNKVLRAYYYQPCHVFKIPKGVDLEDKTKVESYNVKYGYLYINYVNGTSDKIEYHHEEEDDRKYPTKCEIEEDEDYDDEEN